MKLKMLETQPASQDGVTVKTYHAEEVYEVTDYLGKIFLDNEWAEKVLEISDEEIEKDRLDKLDKLGETLIQV